MYYLVISGIVNVILNLFFVIVLHMSVDGVAWATVISQALSMILVMLCLFRSNGGIRFIPRQLRIDRQKLKKIVRIGLPAGLQSLLFSISNVLIQSAVNFWIRNGGGKLCCQQCRRVCRYNDECLLQCGYYFTGQNMGAKNMIGLMQLLRYVRYLSLSHGFL